MKYSISHRFFRIIMVASAAFLCLVSCVPKSIYFKNINVSELYCDSIIHTNIGVPDYIDYAIISKRLMCRINIDLQPPFFRKTVKQVIFYHKSKSCPIFAYTYEELLKMKLDAGFKDKNTEATFLITTNGVKVISNSEFEKLKKDFKPEDIASDISCNKTLIEKASIKQKRM